MITRNNDILTQKNDLSVIKIMKDFPIKCHQTHEINYEYQDMAITISKSSGLIQLKYLVDIEKLYSEKHNDAIGFVWDNHNNKFFSFIKDIIKNNNICEYGGGSAKLAKLAINDVNKWTIIDFNKYDDFEHDKLKVINNNCEDFIDDNSNVFVHSHFLEHLYQPFKFINLISKANINSYHCFSIPNQKKWLINGFGNALFFEHTAILEEEYLESYHKSLGFELINKKYFDEHSIFYIFKKTGSFNKKVKLNDKLFEENKIILSSFFEKINNFVTTIPINTDFNICTAHILTQFLFENGLDFKFCKKIIDNSKLKINKKLYGYNIDIVEPLNANKNILTVIPFSSYKNEIKNNLINSGFNKII
jgi:hypothetical protein